MTNLKQKYGPWALITGASSGLGLLAEVFSTELGRPVTYVDLPVEHWKEVLVKQPEFPEFLAAHLAAVARDHQDGVFSAQTDVVETIGGQAPQSLRDFIRANKPEFTAEPREAVA